MRPDDDSLLVDIVLAAREARRFAASATYDEFLEDRELQLALVKLIEIVGEAASKLSKRIRTATPGVPWAKIVGMRHRLVHEYARIDYRVVWEVVQDHLPVLIAAIEPLIPPEDDGDA